MSVRHLCIAMHRKELDRSDADARAIVEEHKESVLRARVISARLGSDELKAKLEELRRIIPTLQEESKLLPPDPTEDDRMAVWLRHGGPQDQIEKASTALQGAIEADLRRTERGPQ